MKQKTFLLANFKSIPHGPTKKLQLYQYKYCTQEYAFHITRMSKHLIDNCKGCPETIKSAIKSKQKQILKNTDKGNLSGIKRKRETSVSREDDSLQNAEQVNDHALAEDEPCLSLEKITGYIDKTSPKDQEYIATSLAKALYVSGKNLKLTNIFT